MELSKERQEVEVLINQAEEMSKELVNAYMVIQGLPSNLQREFAGQAKEILERFEESRQKLKVSLKGYFEYERKNGLPVVMEYRRIFKEIVKG